MSIAPVFTLLSAASAVTAIIGTNPVRCYPAGIIPQPLPTDPTQGIPCVTWQLISGHAETIMDDRPAADYQRVQIDCWARDFSTANTLANAVNAALELSGNCVSFNGHDYEPDTKRYRVSFDFSFWLTH